MMQPIQWILASDIDNTLTGDPDALKRLAKQIEARRGQQKLALFLTTGRTLDEVLTGFQKEHIPQADAIISQVGTEIYLPPFSPDIEPLAEWDQFLRQHFSREQAEAFLADIAGAEIQAGRYNTPLKVSYFLDKTPDPEQAAALVKQRVAQAENGYQVVWSSGKHLDILPAAAGKGNAIRFLIDYLDLAPQQVITAGDSGNDRSMLEEFHSGIIVGNAQPELKDLRNNERETSFYFAEKNYAAGVEEGLRHFKVF
jgi:sucrose-6F-phosphate phosphohydrolase